MTVPLIPVSGRRGGFISGALRFDGVRPQIDGLVPYEEALMEAYGATGPGDSIAILDVDGLAGRELNTDLVKSRRIRGRTSLLVTCIRTGDDVLDAMCGSFDGVCIPYHTASEEALEESLDLLEEPRAVLFCRDGREVSTGASTEDAALRLLRMGFREALVIDTAELTAEIVSRTRGR